MKTLTLGELIGKTISSLRWSYNACNEYGLQEFYAYLKLSDETIIDIPLYDEEDFLILNEENINYFESCFEKGEVLASPTRDLIEGQSIEDIFFCYENGILTSRRAYLKLSNGYYITEENFGPEGLPGINLLIFKEEEFLERVNSLKENAKSYLKDIKKEQ